MSEVKHFLRKQEFPQMCREALSQLEQLLGYSSSAQQQRLIQEITEEFVFCEVDRRGIRKKRLSAVQELQLLQLLAEYLEGQNNQVARNTIFLNLFLYEGSGSHKIKILGKLISLSIATRNGAVLEASSVWMQQQGCTSDIVVSLVKDIVSDYFILVPRSSSFLVDLPQICLQFASHFLTGTTALYNCPKTEREIPVGLLRLITRWVSNNPQLCLAPLTINLQSSLPRGSIVMPSMTPLAGLVRWCVQAPLLEHASPAGLKAQESTESEKGNERNQMYSQLHIGVLESMMEAEKLRLQLIQKEVITSRDLITLIDGLQILIAKCGDRIDEIPLSLSLERLGQSLQMAIATKCFHGNAVDLCWHVANKLPRHRLLNVILKKYNVS